MPMLTAGLVVALTACTQAAPDSRGVAHEEVLLQVVATGRAEARPDLARFSAGVETIAATAAEASARNNKVMSDVASALERLGINGDDLQTRQITLSRVDYGPIEGAFRPTTSSRCGCAKWQRPAKRSLPPPRPEPMC